MQQRQDIRNIAIIAHVDHGKTTLVDGMLRQTNAFRRNQSVTERVLDSNDLERERGITILAKNTSIEYNGVTINIVDTPGHADFGGEVERVINMVDGALLLVDAVEGPMAQTRFVLRQALAKGLKIILVVNKIDRPAARPDYAVNAAFDLFIDLGASEEQVDFPVIYAKATEGRAGFSVATLGPDLVPLFDTILDTIPPPTVDPDGPTQLLVTALEYSSYVGKIALGRLSAGTLRAGQTVTRIDHHGAQTNAKITKLYTFRDLQKQEQTEVQAGTIVAVAGISEVGIGDTLADPNNPVALPPIKVEEPTVRMVFRINDSPFAGREGKYVTSRQLRERLMRELESNVALRVEELEKAGDFLVSGRGELHLAILIETMRREGYELAVGRPEVIFRAGEHGKRLEPFEQVYVEALNDYWGSVAEMLGKRRGRLLNIRYGDDGTVYGEFSVPTRGILGFRQPFLTATRGTGVFHAIFDAYMPYAGDIAQTDFGSLVSLESGPVSGYALEHLTARGTFFVRPSVDEVYAGQVVGEHIRDEDLVINVCRTKNLTGHRAKPTAIVEALSPPHIMSLDESIEYLHEDELLEVTPESLRIRKMVLDHNLRNRETKRVKYAEAG
ncbi:MAG: translational GTPase TypA [Candidatus Promineofilum sp.]|nr:translational GTPase TypA [Promineifilum sp.]MBP9657993.1 translational GTPase TypA [Promineifilum sp.]